MSIRLHTRAAILAATLLLSVAGASAAPEAGAAGPTSAQIKKLKQKAVKKVTKAVKKEIAADASPDFAQPATPPKIKVASCKQKSGKGGFAGFKCAWNAQGEQPGIVPFKCKGEATTDAKAKVKRIDPCKNVLERQAPLLAAPHDVAFGYIEDFLTHTDLWDELAASGADSILHNLAWDVIQTSEGAPPSSWNWVPYDNLYNQSLAAGTRPIWNLVDAPCWASTPGCNPAKDVNPIANSKISNYAAAAAQIAQRYPQSRAIEVWIEPNNTPFWGDSPNPELYSRLVGATADAVHATGTGVPVYSGGLAPGSAASTKQEFGSFLADALSEGGIERADAIGFHAVTDVPFKPGDDPTDGYLGRLRIQVQELNSRLADAEASKPIAITQLSYSTASYTDAQQAEALVSSYEVLRRIAGVPTVIVSRLLDNGDGSKIAGFGVLKPNRSPKPAYCDLAAARGVASPPGC